MHAADMLKITPLFAPRNPIEISNNIVIREIPMVPNDIAPILSIGWNDF